MGLKVFRSSVGVLGWSGSWVKLLVACQAASELAPVELGNMGLLVYTVSSGMGVVLVLVLVVLLKLGAKCCWWPADGVGKPDGRDEWTTRSMVALGVACSEVLVGGGCAGSLAAPAELADERVLISSRLLPVSVPSSLSGDCPDSSLPESSSSSAARSSSSGPPTGRRSVSASSGSSSSSPSSLESSVSSMLDAPFGPSPEPNSSPDSTKPSGRLGRVLAGCFLLPVPDGDLGPSSRAAVSSKSGSLASDSLQSESCPPRHFHSGCDEPCLGRGRPVVATKFSTLGLVAGSEKPDAGDTVAVGVLWVLELDLGATSVLCE